MEESLLVMTPNEQITLVISALALIISVIFAIVQYGLTRSANKLPVGIDLMREFRSKCFKDESQRAFLVLTSSEDYSSLDVNDIRAVNYVSHFYDNLGLLVFEGAVEKSFILSFMGGTIISTWNDMKSFIEYQRVNKCEPDYQAYFEYLAKESEKYSNTNIRQKLGLK
jgi:hypothetical protein